ncbi:MAG: phosphate ABC transporter substrate-binding protein [Acaryochloridaceae cyanobacterium CSU_5_19]|nr:phosphate ABC transporter substrate-binding protein [Acaryochloridaceae cyanobacterium CSU_5_19]
MLSSALGVTLQSCTAPQAPNQKLVLTGSSSVAPLAAAIAKRYEKLHPQVRIDVQTGGSSRGIADVRQKVADIGMVSRALKPAEQDLKSYTLAQDGISIILHRDNPISKLSNQQIVDIYTGKIKNWQQVGGQDAAITVVNKAEGRSTLELFIQYFKLTAKDIQADVVIGDNEQGIKTVVGNPQAIGYVSIGAADINIKQGTALKLLPINGIAATFSTVQDGSFPLSRPLNLITQGQVSPKQQAFIDFAQSSVVEDLVKEQGFVPHAQ